MTYFMLDDQHGLHDKQTIGDKASHRVSFKETQQPGSLGQFNTVG